MDDLASALSALQRGDADAVVNIIGALQYAVATSFSETVDRPEGVALPPGSALKAPLDRALIEITSSAEWRRNEASYFDP